MLTAAANADGSVHTLLLGASVCFDRAVPSPQMLAEFFTSEIEGGVSAAMGGHSMAEALGATLGQAVGAAAGGAPGGMKFTLDMDPGPGGASGPAASRAGKTRKGRKGKKNRAGQ